MHPRRCKSSSKKFITTAMYFRVLSDFCADRGGRNVTQLFTATVDNRS